MKKINDILNTINMPELDRVWHKMNIECVRFILVIFFIFGFGGSLHAQEQEIDSVLRAELWKQPDFVKAYFVVVEPGGALYSIFGHACLHMVCPAYGLDYFFSYESEGASSRFFKFLAGNLKMGMAGMTAEEYMADLIAEGRGVKEYELNLPIDAKRELWRVLDEKVAEGMDLSYDFESRGCAYACVMMLNEALGDTKIEYGTWSPRFNRTRREMCNDFGKVDYPWNMMFIMALVGTDVDKMLTPEEKLIIPTELVEVWQNAKVNGEYLLSREAHVLKTSTRHHRATWFTPMKVALLLLLLAIIAWFVAFPYIDWLILAIVTLMGCAMTYLVVISTLPCTSWNWLIIPFNILPAICWKWRNYWATPYAVMTGIWIACMIASPHQLIDPSMAVVALAFMVILLNKRNRTNKIQILNRRK